MLAEARARKNLTILEVAQQLKLSASQIEALEADAYARLPGTVFVRGFVRNYARLVDLDGEVLIGALDLPHQPTTASAAVPRSSNIPFPDRHLSRWPRYAAALILLVGALAIYVLLTDEREVVVIAHTPPASSAPVSAAPSSATVPEAKPATTSDSSPPAPAVAVPVVTAPLVAVEENAAASAPVRPSGSAEMHFTFATESWVEVRDRNNRILLSQLNPAGTEQRLHGRVPLTLVVGNAHGVRLTYKGAPVDLAPHTRVEVARLTLE
jgi:cytoskeleton protein RodZ